jgi:hypothetical protein
MNTLRNNNSSQQRTIQSPHYQVFSPKNNFIPNQQNFPLKNYPHNDFIHSNHHKHYSQGINIF